MSATFELYCVLREIDVPAEKARAVVNALEAARNNTPVRGTPSFMRLSDPELQKLRDELLNLKFKNAADTIVIRVTGILLAAVWLMLMIEHEMR
jgi:hypothetical protein